MNASTLGAALLGLVGLGGGGVWVHGIYFSDSPNPPFPAAATGDVDTDAWIEILRHQNYNNPRNFRMELPNGEIVVRDRREAAMDPANTPWTFLQP